MRCQPIELKLKYFFGAFGGNNSTFKCTHFQLQCIDPIQLTKLHKSKISVHFMHIYTCSCCNSKQVHWVLLGSKTLGLNVLKLQFVMLTNYDQNILIFVLDLLKVCLYVKLESSILQDLLCKSA